MTEQPKKTTAAKPTQIVVQTSPNAQVYLDDTFKGQASSQGRLVIENPKPGDHTLRVSLPGKKDFEQQVRVVAGRRANVQAALEDLPGSITVQTSPGAAVSLDNSSRGTANTSGELVIRDVSAGAHELRVYALGKKESRQSITVVAGKEGTIGVALVDIEEPSERGSGVPKRIRVSGQVEAAKLISQSKVEYPPLARMARIVGTVRLEAIIGKDGTIQDLKFICGHPFLVKAAMEAVQRWRYQPTLLEGEPVEVVTEVATTFSLSEDGVSPMPGSEACPAPAGGRSQEKPPSNH